MGFSIKGVAGLTDDKGEKHLLVVGHWNPVHVLVGSMSGYVVRKPVRKTDINIVVAMVDQVCSKLGVPKKLRTNYSSHFRNVQIDHWCAVVHGVVGISDGSGEKLDWQEW